MTAFETLASVSKSPRIILSMHIVHIAMSWAFAAFVELAL